MGDITKITYESFNKENLAKQEAYKAATGSYSSSKSELDRAFASSGKTALTPEQKAAEETRMQEEIQKYGYYTPLEYSAEGDVYYQTSPSLSPSRYLQDSRDVSGRHPAPSMAFEPSATWMTEYQAERKLEAGIASGEYQVSNSGYMETISVRGKETEATAGLPMGVRTYTRRQALEELAAGRELSGPGESPKRRELITGSIIADLVFEGYVKPPKETKEGFELEYTEAGKQLQPSIVSALNAAIPSSWLLSGSSEKLMFSGKPIVFEKETKPLAKSETQLPAYNPFKGSSGVHPLVYEAGRKLYGADSFTITYEIPQESQDTALSSWLSPVDKAIEENLILGAGTKIYKDISSTIREGDMSKLSLPEKLVVSAAKSEFFQATAGAFLTAPEQAAKLTVRLAPAPGMAFKSLIGIPQNELEKEYTGKAIVYGGLITAGVVGFGAGMLSSPLETAASGTSYAVSSIIPQYLGFNLWGGVAEGTGRLAGQFLASQEKITVAGRQLDYDNYFVQKGKISYRFQPAREYTVEPGYAVGENYVAMGRLEGTRGAFLESGTSRTITNYDDVLLGRQVSVIRGEGYGVYVAEGAGTAQISDTAATVIGSGKPYGSASAGFLVKLNPEENLFNAGDAWFYGGKAVSSLSKKPADVFLLLEKAEKARPKMPAGTEVISETPLPPVAPGAASLVTATRMAVVPKATIAAAEKAGVEYLTSGGAAAGVAAAKVVSGGAIASAVSKAITKPKVSLVYSSVPAVAVEEIPYVAPSGGVSSVVSTITRVKPVALVSSPEVILPETRPRAILTPKITPTTSTTPTVVPIVGLPPSIAEIVITPTKPATPSPTIPKVPALIPPAILVPAIPLLPLGFAGDRKALGMSKRKSSTEYKPSLLGVIANVRIPKAPKMVSGAEWARGIVVGKKKKHKRRKR